MKLLCTGRKAGTPYYSRQPDYHSKNNQSAKPCCERLQPLVSTLAWAKEHLVLPSTKDPRILPLSRMTHKLNLACPSQTAAAQEPSKVPFTLVNEYTMLLIGMIMLAWTPNVIGDSVCPVTPITANQYTLYYRLPNAWEGYGLWTTDHRE